MITRRGKERILCRATNLSAESHVPARPRATDISANFRSVSSPPYDSPIVRICELISYRTPGIENRACNSDEYKRCHFTTFLRMHVRSHLQIRNILNTGARSFEKSRATTSTERTLISYVISISMDLICGRPAFNCAKTYFVRNKFALTRFHVHPRQNKVIARKVQMFTIL